MDQKRGKVRVDKKMRKVRVEQKAEEEEGESGPDQNRKKVRVD